MTMLYKGGIPYEPDVKRLNEMYQPSTLKEGRTITRDEISGVLQVPIGSQRFYGVLNSWIKQLRDHHGIYMRMIPSVGVKVLPPNEILEHGERMTHSKLRQASRAIKTFGYVDRSRLDHIGQRRLDHQCWVAGVLKGAIATAQKQMAVELSPVKSLPKRSVA